MSNSILQFDWGQTFDSLICTVDIRFVVGKGFPPKGNRINPLAPQQNQERVQVGNLSTESRKTQEVSVKVTVPLSDQQKTIK